MNSWRTVIFVCACFVSLRTRADIVINEIHYDPPIKTELVEFIELYNTGATAVNVGGWSLTGGVEFTVPAPTSIPAQGYLVLAQNPAALKAKFGANALGPWTGLLANSGDTIVLRNNAGEVVDKVSYQLGFPWPTVGDAPGYSIELVNPGFDNDLGGSWRRSVRGTPASQVQTLVEAKSQWKYHKGTSEASFPINAWRLAAFDDSSWAEGAAPVGYDPSVPMGTSLADMSGNYTSIYLRKKFQVTDPLAVASLTLEALYDDGIQVWINGQRVANLSLPDRDVMFDEVATGTARESASYDPVIINSPASFLKAGENVIAVQVHNILKSGSSDCFVDLKLSAQLGSANAGPTPGARNSVFDTNLPPQIRQITHSPEQPRSGEPVTIAAKVTDPDGVSSVQLLYQTVDPGGYIELNDPAYKTSWTPVAMTDDGSGIYAVQLPASVQQHRRLVRYRIVAKDSGGRSVQAPYEDDPEPNFAYFVYDGVPGLQSAIQPGSTDPTRGQVQNIPAAEMGRLPAYHLIAKRSAVEDATWNSQYGGDLYQWWGTLVYDGKVYDHIRYRARGGVWRYAMGKNMWKFDLNRGHDFEARDNYGERYKTKWKKLNLGANIQQGDFQHRGEQGMFESVGFYLFNLVGVEAPKTHWSTLRIVDEAQEASASNQYGGDFWGLYLAIEQEDQRFLDEHDLPDGNFYKMEGGTGTLNNQGRTAVSDGSDLRTFLNTYRNTTPDESWWRQNFELENYYSYQAIVQGIHHYDICYGKNYFYYLNPVTGQWSVHTWDLDLTWAQNMYDAGCGGTDEFKNRVLTRPPFDLEYKNRVREVRDLLFNTDQAWKVIDEFAGIVKGTNGGPNILAADRNQWDYNPVMNNSSIVNLSKAGQGRFYQFPLESASNPSRKGSFDAAVAIMKDYVVTRASFLDGIAADASIPAKPSISYAGPASYPVNSLTFRSSPYSGASGFAAMKWRVGEVRTAQPGLRGVYEIEPLWESPDVTTFTDLIHVPAGVLKVGHKYRARVRMKDVVGRWSNWSDPVEFAAGEPDNSAALQQSLRPTEIMYNPPAAASDMEFIELRNTNTSTDAPVELAGAAFTEGIDFVFPANSVLAPGEYALVIKADPAAFRAYYALDASIKLFGPYGGSLNNDGEHLTFKTAAAGAEIFSFAYNDRAGWPVAPDGTGHSLVLKNEGTVARTAALEYPGNWRASSYIKGSPGRADPPVAASLVINEFAAHTDYSNPALPEYDSNDWIELFNSGGAASLNDYYLSDDASDLKKWRLPARTLSPGEFVSYDEITGFHNPISSGFGLNKAGESIFLSFLPGNSQDRVLDAVRFKGQENGVSYGRYADGAPLFESLKPTRNQPNQRADAGLLVSELMYHPVANGIENSALEYVELYNAGSSPISFASSGLGYRIDGGATFSFSTNTALGSGQTILVVSFDPADANLSAQFKAAYGLQSSNIVILGPFSGKLGNSSDRISIEKAQPGDLAGDPVSWIILDEAIYSQEWGADGDGRALERVRLNSSGNDPSSFTAANPTPGWVRANALPSDRDADGLPDDWEVANGLNSDDPADAAKDKDGDGMSNLAEYLAGTNPADPGSRLSLNVTASARAGKLTFEAKSGKGYTVQFIDDIGGGTWQRLKDVTGQSGTVTVDDPGAGSQHRYYRLVTPIVP